MKTAHRQPTAQAHTLIQSSHTSSERSRTCLTKKVKMSPRLASSFFVLCSLHLKKKMDPFIPVKACHSACISPPPIIDDSYHKHEHGARLDTSKTPHRPMCGQQCIGRMLPSYTWGVRHYCCRARDRTSYQHTSHSRLNSTPNGLW